MSTASLPQCYVSPPSPPAALTGAGLEVALGEDGGDGGGVEQAVVVVRAQGR